MATAEYQREWRAKHPGYFRDYQKWLRENLSAEDKSKKWKAQKERYRNDPIWREKKLAYNREWRKRRKLQNQAL